MTGPTHFKRYRMERPLAGLPAVPTLPKGYVAFEWNDLLPHLHADVMFESFRDDLDGRLFPNLSDRLGCRALMESIRARAGFCPGATWLVAGPDGYCGSIQGVIEPKRTGAIQNLGIVLQHRGRGLGWALLRLAALGFARAGAGRCYLEVTASNSPAVALYRRAGFVPTRAFYRALPPAPQPTGI